MKGKDLHPRLLYPAKLSFRMEGQIKCFPDKVKFKEFIITKPLLYEMLGEERWRGDRWEQSPLPPVHGRNTYPIY